MAPAHDLPCEVHRHGGFDVTLWTYQPHDDGPPAPGRLAEALFDLHRALGEDRSTPLPSFREELSAVEEILRDPGALDVLGKADRALLSSALDRYLGELAGRHLAEHRLHGSPHDGNTLVVGDDVRFVDFETACVGPLEWDLAHLDDEAVAVYPASFDPSALQACRALVSVKTATWCSRRAEDPEMRWHAEHHLAVVSGFMGSCR